ncbi:MAG: hypothetical protein M5R36_18465 [Deltaproteobacteria bacterium]|nr:hypothetical protein [Deltaproteobacteria bacterium]
MFDEPDEREIAQMQMLLMKLASGAMTQNFTPEEIRIMARLRENKETILQILHHEMQMVAATNARGRDKINNLIRMVEKNL